MERSQNSCCICESQTSRWICHKYTLTLLNLSIISVCGSLKLSLGGPLNTVDRDSLILCLWITNIKRFHVTSRWRSEESAQLQLQLIRNESIIKKIILIRSALLLPRAEHPSKRPGGLTRGLLWKNYINAARTEGFNSLLGLIVEKGFSYVEKEQELMDSWDP
jgi:hypothetical protein